MGPVFKTQCMYNFSSIKAAIYVSLLFSIMLVFTLFRVIFNQRDDLESWEAVLVAAVCV